MRSKNSPKSRLLRLTVTLGRHTRLQSRMTSRVTLIFLLLFAIVALTSSRTIVSVVDAATFTLLDEDFSGGTLPAGWANNDINGNGDTWRFDNPGGRAIPSPLSNPVAIFDSDNTSNDSQAENVALESPAFDVSGLVNATLNFDHSFTEGAGGAYSVEVFDGSTWQVVLSGTLQVTGSESVDISAHVDGVANAQVRFRWTGDWSWYWLIDNVEVTAEEPRFELLSKDFAGGSLPTGWTNNDINGNGDSWRFDNPGGRTIDSPLSDPIAIFDSDFTSDDGLAENVALESPAFDASNVVNTTLNFDHRFRAVGSSAYFVEVFDGSTWQTVLSGSSEVAATSESIDISAFVDGIANAQVRFRWTGDWSWYWLVDNVEVVADEIVLTPGQIEGLAFYDRSNQDGRSTGETGLAGIVVTVSDADGNSVATTTSSDGTFTVVAGSGTPSPLSGDVRVEFTLPNTLNTFSHDFLEASVAGETTVQFANIDTGGIVEAGFIEPERFCPGNPEYAISCFTNGDPTHSSNVGEPAIARARYNDRGGVNPTTKDSDTDMEDTGPVWGLAYDPHTEALYMSAVLRRHTGLGPAGLGAIYIQADVTDDTTVSTFYDFGTVVGNDVANNAARFPGGGSAFGEEGACNICDNVDASVYAQAGKRGLGDIDTTPDGGTLYAVNLFDRQIYTIDVATTSGSGDAAVIASAPWLDNSICSGTGVARPWGLNYHRGSIYVGVTCDASTSVSCGPTGACSDLTGHIYAHDGSTWSAVLATPIVFDYERFFYNFDATAGQFWHPWEDDYSVVKPYIDMEGGQPYVDVQYPQPIIGDIEFLDDGSIAIAVLDRSSLQYGYEAPAPDDIYSDIGERYFAASDVLRIGYNAAGTAYELESDGQVRTADGTLLTSSDPTTPIGPGGQEFYDDRWRGTGDGTNATSDTVVGGIALKPGANELAYAASDAFAFYGAGVRFTSHTDGSDQGGIQIYEDDFDGTGGTVVKAGGLGDIELICALPEIEIGNRIWDDSDSDGQQDPGESGIADVLLGLYGSGGVLIATVETDANGNYIFSSRTDVSDINGDADGTPEFDYSVAIDPDGTYFVAVFDSNFNPGGALENYSSTHLMLKALPMISRTIATPMG